MKAVTVLLALVASSTALSVRNDEQTVLSVQSDEDLYLIESAPGNQRWVSEDQKWELRRVRMTIFIGKQ